MKASNFSLSITGNSIEQLNSALAVAVDDEKALAWKCVEGWLYLYWTLQVDVSHPLPYPHNISAVRWLVGDWLKTVPKCPSPDIDGSCNWEGWELESGWIDGVEHRSAQEYEVLRIRPVWAEYHK